MDTPKDEELKVPLAMLNKADLISMIRRLENRVKFLERAQSLGGWMNRDDNGDS